MNKVGLASFHLDGDSQLWFLKIERDRQNSVGRNSKLNVMVDDYQHLGELSKLHQDGMVDDYQRRFEQLAARASSLTSEQEVLIFISGLQ